MPSNTYVLIGAVAVAAAGHSLIPDHWLPYVLTARARGMPRSRTTLMAGAGAITHLFSTVMLVLVFAMVDSALAARVSLGLERIIGLVVIGLGFYFLWRGFRGKGRQHCHQEAIHEHRYHSDKGSDYVLGAVLGVWPCPEAIPLFLAVSTQGMFSSLAAIGAWVLATVISLVGIVWLTVSGLAKIRLAWLDNYGEVLSGVIIILVGAITLL